MSRMNPLGNKLEQVYLQMIVNYLPKNDLYNFIKMNKKCALALKRSVTNQIPLEPTIRIRKGIVSSYKMYDHLQTLKIYSYEDLLNVYNKVLDENKSIAKFNRRKREKNSDIFVSLMNKDELDKVEYKIKYMEGTIEEKIGKLYDLFENVESKIDENGITKEMIIEGYKRYFPKLSRIEIWLDLIKTYEYPKIKDFIGLYSKKNKWNRQLWFWNQMIERMNKHIEETGLVRLEPNINFEPLEPDENEEIVDGEVINANENDEGFLIQRIMENGHETELYLFEEDEYESEESEENSDDEMNDDDEDDLSEDSKEIKLLKDDGERYDYRIPQGITIIPNSGFEKTLIEDVVLPERVKCIGDYCFKNCRDLTRIIIPRNVEYLGKECFMKCYKLKEIEIDKNGLLYDIREGCFKNCKSIEEFIVPNRVKEIGMECFNGCEKLRRIILNNVKRINKWAFKNCSNLFEIDLTNVNFINGDPFDNTPYKLLKLMEELRNQEKQLLTN